MDRSAQIDVAEREIRETAEGIAARLTAEFDALRARGEEPPGNLGFTGPEGQLGPDGGAFRSATIKYATRVGKHLKRLRPMLPLFEDVASTFDIGVGPGTVFYLLERGLGQRVAGCDISLDAGNPDRSRVYDEFCEAFGIRDRIIDHAVTAREPIPIPEGTECVVAFGSVFNFDWGLDDHLWFYEHLDRRLTGPKRVMWRFNGPGYADAPDVKAFYEARATFPIEREPWFCVIDTSTALR